LEWDIWKPWYIKIKKELKLKFIKDENATKVLEQLLKFRDTDSVIKEAKEYISNQIVFLYGCGPSLEKNVKNLLELGIFRKKIINITADGAISALMRHDIFPEISVTDLDGNINDLLEASQKGTISFIHAHGDNVKLLKKFVPKFKKVIGTTQTRPIGKILNYGGFTDGDRAVFIAELLGAKAIFLVGFDFGTIVGRFSKPNLLKDSPASKNKIKKLNIAKNLIQWTNSWSNAVFYNLTGSKNKIRDIENVQYDKLCDLITKLSYAPN